MNAAHPLRIVKVANGYVVKPDGGGIGMISDGETRVFETLTGAMLFMDSHFEGDRITGDGTGVALPVNNKIASVFGRMYSDLSNFTAPNGHSVHAAALERSAANFDDAPRIATSAMPPAGPDAVIAETPTDRIIAEHKARVAELTKTNAKASDSVVEKYKKRAADKIVPTVESAIKNEATGEVTRVHAAEIVTRGAFPSNPFNKGRF